MFAGMLDERCEECVPALVDQVWFGIDELDSFGWAGVLPDQAEAVQQQPESE